MKKKYRLAYVLILVLFVNCKYMKSTFNKSVEPESGTISVAGLSADAVVRRDPLGIPVIEAANEDDLFFMTGYVMANDRLFQMVSMKLLGQGRVSEMAGKDTLPFDRLMRTLGFKDMVKKSMAALDPKILHMLERFSAGINAYVDTHENLPAEFVLTGYRPEPWKPEDTMYIFCILNLGLSANMFEELGSLVLAEKLGYEKIAWLLPSSPDEPLPFDEAKKLSMLNDSDLLPELKGISDIRKKLGEYARINIPASNNFGLSPKKTKNRKTIIENDTHLHISIPGTWMIIHQKCPGFDAAGVIVPGVPFVSCGYNGTIAWGVTMVLADSQDIFVEKMKNENGKNYFEYKGAWEPVKSVEEIYKVKDEKSVTDTLEYTVHGPLLNRILENAPFPQTMPVQPIPYKTRYGLSLAWATEGGESTVRGFYNMSKARTMADAKKAVSEIKTIYLNFIYGNQSDIAWQVSGAYPVRKKGRGHLPSPGWTGEYDWNGFLPFESLPSKTNPKSGFLVTANNKTIEKGYRHVLSSSWFGPDRADRLTELLAARSDFTSSDVEKIQFDRVSIMANKLQRLLFSGKSSGHVKQAVDSLDEKNKVKAHEALAMLKPENFNCSLDPESANAALYGAFLYSLSREIFIDELGADTPAWEALMDMNLMSYSAQEDHMLGREESPYWDNLKTKEIETKWNIIALSLARAVDLCVDKMGPDRKRWQWGKLHTYKFAHEFTNSTSFYHGFLNRGPYPAGGDSNTVNVSSYPWGQHFDTFMIPAMRFICDFSLEEPAMLVAFPGQSGNPSNSNYSTMIPHFLEGKNNPLPFKKKNIEAQYQKILIVKKK